MYDQSSTEANLATSQVVNIKNEALFLLLYELQQLQNLKKLTELMAFSWCHLKEKSEQ